MFEGLKAKPFDLEAVYASWPDAPIFQGKEKDDPVAWLAAIKAGCEERRVPKEQWHRVGRHYLGAKPRQRIEELGLVMQKMSGDKYTWSWKKFKIAMQNIGWGNGKYLKSQPAPVVAAVTERPVPKKQGSWWIMGRADSQEKVDGSGETQVVVAKGKSASTSTPPAITSSSSSPPAASASASTAPDQLVISKAPIWLVNACTAIEYLTQEHPKVMSAMSAILITVGAIPAIPGIGAVAGGAVLTSGAAHAIGGVLGAVGHMLKPPQDGGMQVIAAH